MPRKIAYWGATGLVGIVTLSAAFSYLTTAPEAVENFRHVGYPQQLRVLLGIGKVTGAIVLLLPRLATLKEWAYAGFTFMWIAAVVAHYLAGDGALSLLPVALIGSLAVCTSRARRIAAVPRSRCWRSGGGRTPGSHSSRDDGQSGSSSRSRYSRDSDPKETCVRVVPHTDVRKRSRAKPQRAEL